MGQHRLSPEARAARRAPMPVIKRVRVVHTVQLENVEHDRVTMLMLGEREPELALALAPDEADKLAEALQRHAAAIRERVPRVILPGGSAALPIGGPA